MAPGIVRIYAALMDMIGHEQPPYLAYRHEFSCGCQVFYVGQANMFAPDHLQHYKDFGCPWHLLRIKPGGLLRPPSLYYHQAVCA